MMALINFHLSLITNVSFQWEEVVGDSGRGLSVFHILANIYY